MADRAVIFVDGNNWFHGLCDLGVERRGWLDYGKISKKLVGPRTWVATRYYIGQINQHHSTTLYAQQRRFLAELRSTDEKISVHFGRIEARDTTNDAARELLTYLASPAAPIDSRVHSDLLAIATRHDPATVYVEKAVDVFLAVDVVRMALRHEYRGVSPQRGRRLHARRAGCERVRQEGLCGFVSERSATRQIGEFVHPPAKRVVRRLLSMMSCADAPPQKSSRWLRAALRG